jgi:Phosphotransferase enzyme family
MAVSDLRPIIHDPEFPAAPMLLGDAGRAAVSSALGEEGGEVLELRTDFVLYTPGRGMTLNFIAKVDWGGDRIGEETVVVHARRNRTPPAGVHTAEVGGTAAGIWRFPADPHLPGLESAADPDFVARLLRDELGFPRGKVSLQLRAYRPGLRAVIQATLASPGLVFRPATGRMQSATHHRVVYLKVLRPGEAAEVAAKHEAFADLLPAPHCLHRDDERAIVVLEAMAGHSLWASLAQDPPKPPAPLSLLEPLDRLAEVGTEGPLVGNVYDAVRSHVHLLHALAPEESERIERIGAQLQPPEQGELITVHGDFYDSQVLVDDGRVVGLLDLDDVGPGERVDDLATMAGRVWTIAQTQPDPARREQITEYALTMLEDFSTVVDPDELDRRVGGILLGRATGPFRAQQDDWPEECVRRIRAAEAWLERPRAPAVRWLG